MSKDMGVPASPSGHSDEPASGLAADAGSVPNAGTITWHCSDEDGGPDVGVSLTLDHGAELWCGEISRSLWERSDVADLGSDTGSWLVVFGPGDDTTVVGKVDYHAGRALLEYVLAPLLRATAPKDDQP